MVYVCAVWCSVGIDRELNATIIIITITSTTGNKKYTGGSSDLSHLMVSLSSEAYRYTGLLMMMIFDDVSVATAE